MTSILRRLVQRLAGPLRFSSGEATILSDHPQLGLCEYALNEGISGANSLVDLLMRIQSWDYGSFQASRGRLKGRKEIAVGELVADHQEINIALRGILAFRNETKDECQGGNLTPRLSHGM